MKSIVSNLLLPIFLAVPLLRFMMPRYGELKDTSSPGDSLREDITLFVDNLCFYKIYMNQDHPDYVVEGLFRIIDRNNRMGFADEHGNVIIKPVFEYVRPFNEGFAAFNVGGKVNRENSSSEISGGKWGFINKSGMVVISPVYDVVSNYEAGEIKVLLDGTEFILTDIQTESSGE
ncbi:MAG: WG repeat-containing protein [Bacteroidales bacterium]